jgi:predicted Zn finger-like uncharacterized protein
MRIACPNCSAEYDVPESLLATGPRLLRCARCAHQFEAVLPGAEAPATPREAAAAPPAAAPPVAAPQPAGPAPTTPPDPPPEPPPPAQAPVPDVAAAPPLEVTAPLVDRPPPTRGLAHHSPIDPPAPEPPPPRERQRFVVTLAVAWLASLVVIFAAGWATYTYHEEITAAWPPIARLYQALGIE